MPESEDENFTVQPPRPMQAAQHKFLLIGVVLLVMIGGGMVWLNESVKQETKFQEALDAAAAAKVKAKTPGLSYQPEAKPSETASPAPTTLVPPAE